MSDENIDYDIDVKKNIETIRNTAVLVKKAHQITKELLIPELKDCDSIHIVACGAHTLVADILKDIFEEKNLNIPVRTCSDYTLSKLATKQSLVICISQSGNEEQVISAYRNAKRLGCQTICITGKGKLKEVCKINNENPIEMPESTNISPINTVLFSLTAVLVLLHNATVLTLKNDINGMFAIIKQQAFEEKGKELAQKMHDALPISFTMSHLSSINTYFEKAFLSIAKQTTHTSTLPDALYLDMEIFSNKHEHQFAIIFSDTSGYHKIKDDIEDAKKIIRNVAPVTEVALKGETALEKISSAIMLITYSAYFHALLHSKNPLEFVLAKQ